MKPNKLAQGYRCRVLDALRTEKREDLPGPQRNRRNGPQRAHVSSCAGGARARQEPGERPRRQHAVHSPGD